MTTQWNHPEHLDALSSAPEHHKLIFENEKVRVLETLIKPGDMAPIHTHRHPSSYTVMSWSHFIRYDADGIVLLDSRTVPEFEDPGVAFWGDSSPPHMLKNIGDKNLHLIATEIKCG
ncbi:MAG: hypothetical protein ACW99Q_09720 [Candidatus Kariarchaeaceae archaeon]|jgi:hypothetical protein